MNKEWRVTQHSKYLANGLIICLLVGFIVGGAVALATSPWWLAAMCGALMSIWAGLIYFGARP